MRMTIIKSKEVRIDIQLLHFLEQSKRSPPEAYLRKIDRLLYTSKFKRIAYININLHFRKYLTHKQWLLCLETIRKCYVAKPQRGFYSDSLLRQIASPISNELCEVTTQLMTEFCRATGTLRMVKFTHIVENSVLTEMKDIFLQIFLFSSSFQTHKYLNIMHILMSLILQELLHG
jgi:hypothetical protein